MSRPRRILIVEDEPNVRLVFRTALESNDTILSTAEDGETALKWLKQDPVDLVLLDLQMPGVGGMETLRRLRATGNDVPVVIVTAHDGVPNVVQAMKLGAIDFLPKPLTPDALRKVVAEVLQRHATEPSPTKAAASPAADVGPSAEILAQAKQALNQRKFDEAEALLRGSIALDSTNAEPHYLLGVLYELRDERHAAYTFYRSALRVDPEYEPAKFHLMKYYNDKLM